MNICCIFGVCSRSLKPIICRTCRICAPQLIWYCKEQRERTITSHCENFIHENHSPTLCVKWYRILDVDWFPNSLFWYQLWREFNSKSLTLFPNVCMIVRPEALIDVYYSTFILRFADNLLNKPKTSTKILSSHLFLF